MIQNGFGDCWLVAACRPTLRWKQWGGMGGGLAVVVVRVRVREGWVVG